MTDYKKTLCLPQTAFPMKANLRQKEPETLAFWQKIDAYAEMVRAGEGQTRYVLHDGPPYANGHIHMGTAMNKVLKDMVVKSRSLAGYRAEYVPGWDCHGLPIEHKVAQELKAKGKVLPPLAVRKICREYATKFLGIQREEFKRLGVFGTWDAPYRTMDPVYEAATARSLGAAMRDGYVTRGKKPIYWCISCETALAEAEVEYADHTSPSIYVSFPLPDARLETLFPGAEATKADVIIWTTTPWTLPGNQAVAVHPDFDYALVYAAGGFHLLARELLGPCAKRFGWSEYSELGTVKGAALEGLVARHPFIDRPSPVVLATYVTLDTGTGCVHTAPGHGREDYETGLKYGLEVLSPLSDKGRFLDTVEGLAGLTVFEANPKVIEMLKTRGRLLATGPITHSYPHCWRCKEPVIFRATTQWFVSMEAHDLRARTLGVIKDKVEWIPSWGRERIHSMIENRPDWCISRQRTWGVPIVALLCEACDEVWAEPDWYFKIVDRFETFERGCDWWFEAPMEEVVPAGLTCPHCGGKSWKKEDDILDVWFDSGTSFAAVLEKRPECRFPADLYLEGTDQHRGWFHSSLLASMATRGEPPYRSVLTHGYVVDGDGRKMSKSLGNVVAPQEIIDKYGAEVLRLWVSAVNYQEDVRISDEILERLVDAYRRIRNTCRYLLGNLSDFSPDDVLSFDDLLPLDRYALDTVRLAHNRVAKSYEQFQFHRAFHTVYDLCVTDLSAFYLDVIKDRLYTSGQTSRARRSAQTVLWKTLKLIIQDMAPILSFTAEEVFQHLPEALKPANTPTVFAYRWHLPEEDNLPEEERQAMDKVVQVRNEITKAIEPVRKSGVVGHSLETAVTVYGPAGLIDSLNASGADLREMCIVSQVRLAAGETPPENSYQSAEISGLAVAVARVEGGKCQRCWTYSTRLGESPAHPDLCERCTPVVEAAV
jgi:isoleucyl-tRNA synthetase